MLIVIWNEQKMTTIQQQWHLKTNLSSFIELTHFLNQSNMTCLHLNFVKPVICPTLPYHSSTVPTSLTWSGELGTSYNTADTAVQATAMICWSWVHGLSGSSGIQHCVFSIRKHAHEHMADVPVAMQDLNTHLIMRNKRSHTSKQHISFSTQY